MLYVSAICVISVAVYRPHQRPPGFRFLPPSWKPNGATFAVLSATALVTNLVLWSQDHPLLHQFLDTHFFKTPVQIFCVQLKEYQLKLHREVAHKPVCVPGRVQFGRNLREDPGGRAKKFSRWVTGQR